MRVKVKTCAFTTSIYESIAIAIIVLSNTQWLLKITNFKILYKMPKKNLTYILVQNGIFSNFYH